MQPQSRRIPTADGLHLHALQWSQEGVLMLLIHGFGNEAHIWDDFAPTVAPHYRVVALDLRGHGDSDWDAEGGYEYEHHVADVEAVIDFLGGDRVVLVSHSLGGRVAMLYASRHPERMAGLVIVDSAPELDPRGISRIALDVGTQPNPSFRSVAEFEATLPHAYPAATPAAIHRMAAHGIRRSDDGQFVLKMDPTLRGFGQSARSAEAHSDYEARSAALLWAALGAVRCPTLVVRGAASDFLSADIADRMVDDELSDGRLAVVPQAGHSVMTDNPPGFADAVCQFVLG